MFWNRDRTIHGALHSEVARLLIPLANSLQLSASLWNIWLVLNPFSSSSARQSSPASWSASLYSSEYAKQQVAEQSEGNTDELVAFLKCFFGCACFCAGLPLFFLFCHFSALANGCQKIARTGLNEELPNCPENYISEFSNGKKIF